MTKLTEAINKFSEQVFPEVVDHYHWLHRHPELSYREKLTSEYICHFLEAENIPYRKNIGGYGILAWVKGQKPENGRTIAFVADMDALPVQEKNEVEYKSENEGVMHACGHDAQSAAMMGAAKIVSSLRNEFSGNVLFVFQPGEEQSPGGADLMLKDGVFRDFHPEFIVKQHAYIDLPAGTVGFQSGTIMASADEVHITVKGQGGHGALPHELNDTVLAASNIIVAMQQVVSRLRNPFNPMVLSFGKFIANGATNVIPSEVTLEGSLRCMDEDERQRMLKAIPRIAKSVADAYGCICETVLPDGYPCVVNDEVVNREVRTKVVEYLGEACVKEFPKRMTADDFGFFSQLYPCCYYRFGVAGIGQKPGALHSDSFLIDESSLMTAAGAFAYIALSSLLTND
jgi:hippurate hydrolase